MTAFWEFVGIGLMCLLIAASCRICDGKPIVIRETVTLPCVGDK